MARAIGIDLGTTYTVVATIQDGRPQIVPNAEGGRLTPSVVTFAEGKGFVVGDPAKSLAATNPQTTIFSIKRWMGSHRTLRVAGRKYSPQEVCSFILRKVRADAEAHLGEGVHQVVITVPAYFNDLQRKATREAALLAGLQVAKMINEPTAAALAYGLEREDVHTVLVWDLGGGTFDVAILDLGEGIFEVRSVSGDTRLGGDDIDQRVMGYLAGEYRRLTGTEFPEDDGSRNELREAAERAKVQLSSSVAAQVRLPLPGSPGERCVEVELSRAHLEDLISDLLQRMELSTRQALSDAGLAPGDIDRIILVGGSTRIPSVRQLVRSLMGKEPYRYIDPDEVVAMGAAIHAGMLTGLVEKAVLLDVLPLSLGVETQGGLAARIIHRNTPLPASGTRLFTTASDYQASLDIHVLQGERELAQDNISLGRFQVEGIPLAPRGVPRVEVAFKADVDGMIHACATDLLTDREVRVEVVSTKHLDQTEIAFLAEQAEQSAEDDRKTRERIASAIEAQNLISAAELVLSREDSPYVDPQAQQVGHALSRLKQALEHGLDEENKALIGEMRQLLEKWPQRVARDPLASLH